MKAVIAVSREGAEAIHLHVRNVHGEETLDPVYVNQVLTILRRQVPHLPIGISTGEWIEPDLTKRLELMQKWDVLPDFVSLNIHEEGFQEVAEVMQSKGIGLEAGIYHQQAARAFIHCGFSKNCIRVLIEPQERNLSAAHETITDIIQVLDTAEVKIPKLLHGFDATTWPLIEVAKRRGFDVRIGFEDCLFLPGGELAEDNVALLSVTQQIMNDKKI